MADYHSDTYSVTEDNDPQIVEHTNKQTPAKEVIDFTMDSDGDDQITSDRTDQTAAFDRHIKVEPQDDQKEQLHSEHPDDSENVAPQNIYATSESMAAMLRQFDSNATALPENRQAREKSVEIKQECDVQAHVIKADTEAGPRPNQIEQEPDHQENDACARTARDTESALFVPEKSPALPIANPRKRRSDDVDDSDMDVSEAIEDSDNNDLPKRPKINQSKIKQPKSSTRNARGSTHKSKIEKPKSARNRRRKKAVEPEHFNLNSLMNHDMVADANANEGLEAQPGFTTARTKKDALAQLIASIPESERNLYVGDKVKLDNATKNFNVRGAMKADGNGLWKLRGMKSSLEHYQFLGVSWMRERENQGQHPRGGLLGDGMGLGKTVSAITNIVDGRQETPGQPRATLIVVPPALMSQWLREIEKHVEDDVLNEVMVYRSKMKLRGAASILGHLDIVITSYHEVVASLPKNEPPPEIHTPKAKLEWWNKEIEEKKGPLHRVKWHRIVLDEAQAIKNYRSRTSEAICRLNGRYRWCLSGTPVQNNLDEFYPYFKFLKCKDTGDFELFKRNFTKRGSHKALERLQIFLNKIMLRRTHADKMFGRPILQLPPIKPVETIVVRFNAVERTIYHIIEQRFAERVQELAQETGAFKAYSQMFVLLLRLRQLVSHPLLIQKTLKQLLKTEDIERLWALTKNSNQIDLIDEDVDPDGSCETAAGLKAALERSKISPRRSMSEQVSDNPLSCQFRKYLEAMHKDGTWRAINERSLCSACDGPPERPFVTSCLHLYCFDCLNALAYEQLQRGQEGKASCLCCGRTIEKSAAYAARGFEGAGMQIGGKTAEQEDIDWYGLPGPMLQSAKIKGVVSQVKKWFTQDPLNKIVIFTQFRGIVEILGNVCMDEEWEYARFTGEMPHDSRDAQIVRFTEDCECRILICSLKAGGVGLNLTAGNRVIIIDLWWNSSVEAQAFSRCFRIGQKRDVEVVRFVVHNSIDSRIQRLQERKLAEIGKAMNQQHDFKYTTTDLIELFGGQSDNGDTPASRKANPIDETFVFSNDPYDSASEDEDRTSPDKE